MTTRVTVQISHANRPVEVQVLSRNAAGHFVATMRPTVIEREGEACTFHVYGNQQLLIVESEQETTTGDGSGIALPPMSDSTEARQGAAVYSHPECVFNYCPNPEICRNDNVCISAAVEASKQAADKRATAVPPPLPSTSADSPDDVAAAAAAAGTDEDTDRA